MEQKGNREELILYWHFASLVRDHGFRKAVSIAKEWGFDGIELLASGSPFFSSVHEAEEAGRIVTDAGLKVACYSVGVTLYGSEEVVEQLKIHSEQASAVGSPYLHHTLYLDMPPASDAPSFDAVCEDVVTRACTVAKECRSLGLTCLYEEQGMYFNGLDAFGSFFNIMKAECDNVGMCLDLGNSWDADCSPLLFIDRFAEDIRHVHVKDFERRLTSPEDGAGWHRSKGGWYLKDTVPGRGVSNIPTCIDRLRQISYHGCYAFELELPYPVPFFDGLMEAMRLFEVPSV